MPIKMRRSSAHAWRMLHRPSTESILCSTSAGQLVGESPGRAAAPDDDNTNRFVSSLQREVWGACAVMPFNTTSSMPDSKKGDYAGWSEGLQNSQSVRMNEVSHIETAACFMRQVQGEHKTVNKWKIGLRHQQGKRGNVGPKFMIENRYRVRRGGDRAWLG